MSVSWRPAPPSPAVLFAAITALWGAVLLPVTRRYRPRHARPHGSL